MRQERRATQQLRNEFGTLFVGKGVELVQQPAGGAS